MAVRWAITSGNWNDTSTWNDGATLGVPVAEDTVYLNGYTVNAKASINIGRGTIRNDLFEQTGRSGGTIRSAATASISVSANVYCTSQIFNSTGASAYNYSLSYNGHLICEGNGVNIFNIANFAVGTYNGTFEIGDNRLFALTNTTRSITINGNVYADSGGSIANQTLMALTVNGVLNCGNSTAITTLTATNIDLPNNNNLNGTTLICNGNITIGDSSYISFTTTNFNNIDEVVTIGHNSRYSSTTYNFNGKLIQYYDDSLGIGGLTFGNATVLHIQNDDFRWVNLSEPRLSKYVILTDYDLSNTNQYPSPANVKKDVPYAWGELVGQYLPDYPPESVVLKDYEYDTITAEENDIAIYNLTRYIYADYGTLHWFELKTTTTDIVTDPTLQSIDIDGDTVVADTDYIVEYSGVCYQWSGSAWGSITTNNIGTIKTDIVTNTTETTLSTKKGILDLPTVNSIVTAIKNDSDLGGKINTTNTNVDTLLSRLTSVLTQRLGQSVTVEILQQILVAHLDN